MVWAAVTILVLAAISLFWRERYWRMRLQVEEVSGDTLLEELNEAQRTARSATDAADKVQARYDALVEKIRIQAFKPDDGIIHAKNSGDVRRLFEQQVNAEQMKREKQQEN